jgi:DHA1 family bicyclomycin/chloramphenicol resistance-like MFS transporter
MLLPIPIKNQRLNELIFFLIVTINTILISMDADIYVPSFPSILEHFKTTEEKVQLILGANFMGLCIGSLFCGPFSDCYGRRKPLVLGMLIFTIGAIGSWLSSSIEMIIFCRFIQGIGSASPIIIGGAALFDLYKKEDVIKLIAIWNSIGTASMAGAPLIGSLLNQYFGWRSIFFFILAISLIQCFFTIIFFKETIKLEHKRCFDLKQILLDYKKLAIFTPFTANSIICALMYAAIMVYTSNLSLIFINHLQIPEKIFSYYQSSTMVSFMVFSVVCPKLIDIYGLKTVKLAAIGGCLIGTIALLLTSIFMTNSALLISCSMGIYTSGVALGIGIFGARSMEFFPALRGTASALGTAYRLAITSLIVWVSGRVFNGTIMPVAWIILFLMVIIYLLYIRLRKIDAKA